MTVTTYLSGDLVGIVLHAARDHQLAIYMGVYTFIAYIAISIHMTVVKRFGGVAAVVLATARKGMTLVLSFLLFPKAFSWYYVSGAFLVLGGILLSSLYKINQKKKKDLMDKNSEIDEEIAETEKLLNEDEKESVATDASKEESCKWS